MERVEDHWIKKYDCLRKVDFGVLWSDLFIEASLTRFAVLFGARRILEIGFHSFNTDIDRIEKNILSRYALRNLRTVHFENKQTRAKNLQLMTGEPSVEQLVRAFERKGLAGIMQTSQE
jgi:hypothetical protein